MRNTPTEQKLSFLELRQNASPAPSPWQYAQFVQKLSFLEPLANRKKNGIACESASWRRLASSEKQQLHGARWGERNSQTEKKEPSWDDGYTPHNKNYI